MNDYQFVTQYVLVAILAVIVFGIGILVGVRLVEHFQKDRRAERILKTHRKSIGQIDDAVNYYVGLQQYIAERLARLRE
jgi:hypothetical protein